MNKRYLSLIHICCINRLVDATQGAVFFDGEDVTGLDKKGLRRVRTKTGMIFQHYNLVERLSVMENVLHGRLGQKGTLAGMIGHYSEEEKVEAFAILEKLGLAEQALSLIHIWPNTGYIPLCSGHGLSGKKNSQPDKHRSPSPPIQTQPKSESKGSASGWSRNSLGIRYCPSGLPNPV